MIPALGKLRQRDSKSGTTQLEVPGKKINHAFSFQTKLLEGSDITIEELPGWRTLRCIPDSKGRSQLSLEIVSSSEMRLEF